jgi:type 1 glutamine amidotransferase
MLPTIRRLLLLWITVVLAMQCGDLRAQSIPAHQEERIRQAVEGIRPQAKPQQRRRVLIWNTPPHLMDKDPHKGCCIPYGEAAFRILGELTGVYEPAVSDDLAMFTPENLGRFDAIVVNNASGPWITPTDDDLRKPAVQALGADREAVERRLRESFLEFIAGGKGVVCIHYAIAANRHWQDFAELFGATFVGHPWTEEVGVTVEEPEHPLLAAFEGKDFRIVDEIYEYGPPYDRSRVRVLLSIDPATTNMGARWIQRKDDDFALAWVKSYGKGRVFVTSFGHMTQIYFDPRMLRFFLDAIQWACGDLPAPATPRPDAPVRANIPGREPVPELPGFVRLFDGKTLAGWQGDPEIWSVQDGTITGETRAARPLRENQFLVWKDQVEDFELRLKFRLENGNSGIYFRAQKRPPGKTGGDPLVGPQADFDVSGRWTGVLMEYLGRGPVAERGEKVRIDASGKKEVLGSVGDPAKLLAAVRPGDWNEYTILARGGHIQLKINGVLMCEVVEDLDPKRPQHGWLGLQVHVGPPMRVQFKDIYLRRF